jgi:hypothetical protein
MTALLLTHLCLGAAVTATVALALAVTAAAVLASGMASAVPVTPISEPTSGSYSGQ